MLRILVEHGLIEFEQESTGEITYRCNETVTFGISRSVEFAHAAKTLYGDAAELIVEELQLNGRLCMSHVIRKVVQRMQEALGIRSC